MMNKTLRTFTLISCFTALTACEGESESTDPVIIGNIACGPEHAVAFSKATQNTDYSAIVRQAVFEENGSNNFLLIKNDDVKASGLLSTTKTDYVTSTIGRNLYYIGRDDTSTIQKYDGSSIITGTGLYQTENGLGYSLKDAGDTEGANPHAIGFINESYAIVPRRNSTDAWLVNLDAQQESDFKICELDLSAYTTSETLNPGTDNEKNVTYPPHMFNVSINENYAAITMQRLHGFKPVESSYVAIFDLNTWEEIDTNPNTEGLKGLELKLKNPQSLAQSDDSIYIGSIIYTPYNFPLGSGCKTGGIEKINLTNLTTEIIDDTTCYDDVAVTQSGKLYGLENHSINYRDTDGRTLYEVNTTTKEKAVVAGFEDTVLNSIDSYNDEIWYSQNNAVGRINTITNTKAGTEVTLDLPSRGISFINL